MKKKIIFTLMLVVLNCTVNRLFAQDGAVAKTAGYDLKKNVKCRVASTTEGSIVVFENAVVAPRDIATGQSSGKRTHKPFNIIKEYRVSAVDNLVTEVKSPRDLATGQASGKRLSAEPVAGETLDATGVGTGKATLQDMHFVVNNGGTKRELPSANGECDLPADLPDGTYVMTVSWSWGMSQSAGTGSGMSAGRTADKPVVVSFLLEVKDGNYVAINEKGLPGEKKPVKKTK
jgi:hypothetical protein